jgi:hypothetical protein
MSTWATESTLVQFGVARIDGGVMGSSEVAAMTNWIGAQSEQQCPPEEVRQRVRRAVGVPLDFGVGVRSLEAGVLDEEVR